MDPNNPSLLDPPNHLFRIRLACVLLETCGIIYTSNYSSLNSLLNLLFQEHTSVVVAVKEDWIII